MQQQLNIFNEATIYLMGISFIVGSFTTILALIILEVSKLRREKREVIPEAFEDNDAAE